MDLCVYWKAEVGLFFQWWKISLDQITGWWDESKAAFISQLYSRALYALGKLLTGAARQPAVSS